MIFRAMLFTLLFQFQFSGHCSADVSELLEDSVFRSAIRTVDWDVVPRNFDVSLWLCGKESASLSSGVTSRVLSLLITNFFRLSWRNFQCDKEKFHQLQHEVLKIKSPVALKIVVFEDESFDLPLQLSIVHSTRHYGNKPLLVVMSTANASSVTAQGITLRIRNLQPNFSFDASSITETENATGNYASDYSFLSGTYLLFLSSSQLTQSEDDQPPHFAVFEIYGRRSDFWVKVVDGPSSFLDISTLIFNRTARRNQLPQTVTGVAENSMSTAYEVSFWNNIESPNFKGGFGVSMYRDLQHMLNFTERAMTGSSIWMENGKMQGKTFELLQNREADISVLSVSMTLERAQELTFLQPVSPGEGVKAFFVQPPLYSFRNILFSPFRKSLWRGLILVYFGIVIAVTGISVCKLYWLHDASYKDATFKDDSYIWALGTFCQKGWPCTPDAIPLRIVFYTSCVTGLLCYVAYSGAIVSSLSVKVVPVSQFSQLLSFGYEFYVHNASSTLQTTLKELIKTFNLSQQMSVTDTDHEVSYMRTMRKSFLSYPELFFSTAYALNETDRSLCEDIAWLQVPVSSVKSAMFLRKGSDLASIFAAKLTAVRERGFVRRYLKKSTLQTKPICISVHNLQTEGLGLDDVFTALLIVLVGVAGAITILCLEKLLFLIKSRNGSYRKSPPISHPINRCRI